ncbi:putative tail protein [Litoreibacter halocynthiae]|uniref:Putative tail protein n=1 Tax=Litoreibacter halocynthiae TaxID=1242689 RepID=A0A4R7LQE0_9RHOB|nr:glycoside hydrolase/phage tail family protein [Litoreibacter halocynthiae]TDT78044.1 putative tail protein [Litoreibacter halocynthiae]
MATILLSAAGAAVGGVLGSGAFGISSVVIGRAIGATIGRAIDQRLMGSGSQTVESGRLDRMRVMGASEGGVVPRVFGRMRVPGNVIWTSRFKEKVTVTEQRGGKGGGPKATNRQYSYCISIAVALCEGEIARVGRIWADGTIIRKSDLSLRVYTGSKEQQPDPVMSAIEGEGTIPAYRGLAYVVIEDMDLSEFGNRVPQLTFEVIRPSRAKGVSEPLMSDLVQAVALMPGSGEFALATTPVYRKGALGEGTAANVNSAEGVPDLVSSLDALTGELPNCRSTSLVVSWFGDDLRAGHCKITPKVEDQAGNNFTIGSTPVAGADPSVWSVSGIDRGQAEAVARADGAPIYGGTPSDASVIEAIAALKIAGQDVMFYPFILMDQIVGNTLPDPYSGDIGQPALPWRGRITSDRAVGVAGSTDGTAAAYAEVAALMGSAHVSDFTLNDGEVIYSGPAEYSYRRFILHYAHLCAASGGVDAFCIGSEMRGLTQIRDDSGGFPAVEALRVLAGDVRGILGPDAKIGYAADWSEYAGYQPQDGTGDLLYHLDPLWADDEIDFVGIDNYMPIADWRDGDAHLDAEAGSIYDLDYLRGNIRGGEGYDWYYRDDEERALQIRTPIEDGAHGEPWVYRYKDLWNWWGQAHHDRVGGVRSSVSSAWEPQSKPIWFTEMGCAAIDKGPNQPNKFLDPKSSESAIPHFSKGKRDDYVQMQYLRAYYGFFGSTDNNPVSPVYDGPMVDMSRAFVWAWDARPWPDFPSNLSVWSDGQNHVTGHWLTGRTSVMPLAHVVGELCESVGLSDYDATDLHGVVRGFSVAEFDTPRSALQPLMIALGFDAIERGGKVVFQARKDASQQTVDEAELVVDGQDVVLEQVRAPEAETVGEVRLGYVEAEGEFVVRVADARFPHDGAADVTQNELPLALTEAEATTIAERWLSEARVARDAVSFSLPPSRSDLRAGDLAELTDARGDQTLYRVDRVEDRGARRIEAVRVERQIYTPSEAVESVGEVRPFAVPVPVSAQFMDLPLLKGDEVAHAPYVAASARPWPGGVAVYSSAEDSGYTLNTVIETPARMGVLATALGRAEGGLWQRGEPLRVTLSGASLSSESWDAVLNGANVAAIGEGSSERWEVIQFASANLVAANTYDLSDLLRGQAGSDGLMPDSWPVGSRFVMLDGGPAQIGMEMSSRELARHYRIGPSLRPYDDPSFRYYVEAFQGVGLRPYAPAHLKSRRLGTDLEVSWIRRTRIDGDSWASVEVPLGEEVERYVVRVSQGGSVARETEVQTPTWTYSSAAQAADGLTGPYNIEVAQVSLRFGPGLYSRIEING